MMLLKRLALLILTVLCGLVIPSSFAGEQEKFPQAISTQNGEKFLKLDTEALHRRAVAQGRRLPPIPATVSCPLPFGKWELIPEFSDEFDGQTLDETKWFPNNPQWKGREPGFFSKKNVEVKDGMLHLSAKAESLPDLPKGYHTFTTAAVQSKNRVKYGYFEVRCRPMNSAASSAFWFYAQDDKLWTEIDVFEIGGKAPDKEHRYFTTLHVFKTPETGDKHWSDAVTWPAPYRLADEFHVYGFLWSKDELVWYVDGKEIRRRKNTDWHQALTMNFDSETMPDWFGLPDPKDLPSVFSIDYVRSWKRIDEDGQSGEQPREQHVEQPVQKTSDDLRKFHVCPEITHLTEPLTSDGQGINYLLALDRMFGPPDVGSEENGFRLFAEKIICDDLKSRDDKNFSGKSFWELMCERLKLDPEKKPALSLPDFRSDFDAIYYKEHDLWYGDADINDKSKTAPEWREFFKNYFESTSKPDHYEALSLLLEQPELFLKSDLVKKKIEESRDVLAIVAESLRKPSFYIPKVGNEKMSLMMTLLPYVQTVRKIPPLLACRVMQNLADKKIDLVFDDLQTMYLLARHLSKQPMIVEYLVGHSLESQANEAVIRLLRSGSLSREELVRLQKMYDELPPFASASGTINAERYLALSTIQGLAFGIKGSLPSENPQKDNLYLYKNASWGTVAVILNQWYDKIENLTKIEDLSLRREAVRNFEKECERFFQRKNSWTVMIEGPDSALARIFFALLCPAVGAVFNVEERQTAWSDLVRLAITLELYKRDHDGKYPESLQKLVPEYLCELPLDPTDPDRKVYRYQQESPTGYLLYAFGRGNKDESGRTEKDDPPGKNQRIRMPVDPIRR